MDKMEALEDLENFIKFFDKNIAEAIDRNKLISNEIFMSFLSGQQSLCNIMLKKIDLLKFRSNCTTGTPISDDDAKTLLEMDKTLDAHMATREEIL